MNAKEATRQYRLSQWLPLIKEHQTSGMSIRAWCHQNDVNEQQFYYWQRKIREKASESFSVIAQEPKFIQVPATVTTPLIARQDSPEFIPSMIIRVGKITVELTDHVQPELLASVLKVLSNA